MNQLSMPLTLSRAHKRVRHAKAKDCMEAQDAREPSWSQQALEYLKQFADVCEREGREFLCEEYRYWATTQGLPKPENPKAFGSVITTAIKAGAIHKAGTSTNTRNASIKATYSKGRAIART
jgi:hypothetical protein